jgi:hypothetical protein
MYHSTFIIYNCMWEKATLYLQILLRFSEKIVQWAFNGLSAIHLYFLVKCLHAGIFLLQFYYFSFDIYLLLLLTPRCGYCFRLRFSQPEFELPQSQQSILFMFLKNGFLSMYSRRCYHICVGPKWPH